MTISLKRLLLYAGVTATILILSLIIILKLTNFQLDSDVLMMNSLIAKKLPLKSSQGAVFLFLQSSEVNRFEHEHNFDYLHIYTPFSHVSTYVQGNGSQMYPGGKALEAELGRNDRSKTLTLTFFFDVTNRYTGTNVEKAVPSL